MKWLTCCHYSQTSKKSVKIVSDISDLLPVHTDTHCHTVSNSAPCICRLLYPPLDASHVFSVFHVPWIWSTTGTIESQQNCRDTAKFIPENKKFKILAVEKNLFRFKQRHPHEFRNSVNPWRWKKEASVIGKFLLEIPRFIAFVYIFLTIFGYF